MKFNSKIVLMAVVPAGMFVLSLAVSIGALVHTRSSFDSYLASDQAVEHGLSEMYAQGLQMGQALRNVVLDSSNPKAMENFQAAQSAYDAASLAVLRDSAGSALHAQISGLAELRSAQATAQQKVLSLVATPEQAIATLNKEETPAWRKLRQALIDLREISARNSLQTHALVSQQTEQAILWSICISLFAAAAALVMNLRLMGTVRSELGGDPAQARQTLGNIAQGDLSTRIDNLGGAQSLMGVMGTMQASLRELVAGVRSSAAEIATATDEIAAGSQDLSNRTEREASSLQETAASADVLSSQVRDNAENARQANLMARTASDIAVQGGDAVGQVVTTMKGINDASRRIYDIISVIDGIAFQTNILALNAAVEAARAGEQGRGFAVVASEVRSLASRSAEAAKEIKTLIGASVDRVEQGTLMVNQAGQTMTEVVNAIRRVTDIMQSIDTASKAQATGVSQVGEAVTHLDASTQQNAALVEQMAAAASSLKSQAGDLVRAVAVFQLDPRAALALT